MDEAFLEESINTLCSLLLYTDAIVIDLDTILQAFSDSWTYMVPSSLSSEA